MNTLENVWINYFDSARVLTLPIILDIWKGFEYASDIKCARVLNMPRYSYNNIIIDITNVIILEFLSAWFVTPGALQLTNLSFFNTS